MIGRLSVGLLTGVVAAPVGFIGFAMGLVVVEWVIFPTAVLVTAVVTALVASWLTDWLAGDGLETDMNAVTRRNLAWGLVPALGALAYSWFGWPFSLIFLLAAVVVWTASTGTRFAFQHRMTKTPLKGRLARSAVWLLGAGLATAGIIFVASLFGLTGA